jgi:hypothetical protein
VQGPQQGVLVGWLPPLLACAANGSLRPGPCIAWLLLVVVMLRVLLPLLRILLLVA